MKRKNKEPTRWKLLSALKTENIQISHRSVVGWITTELKILRTHFLSFPFIHNTPFSFYSTKTKNNSMKVVK